MIKNFILLVFWFAVWCALSYPLSAVDVALGIITAAFVTYMTVDLAGQIEEKKDYKKGNPLDYLKRALWFLYYIPVFLWECIKANFDVAYRVLHPDLPIRPGIINVKVGLKSDIGLTFLANSVTLTPGTTSIDVDKNSGILCVHCIYVKDEYLDGSKNPPVIEKFEKILKKVFE